MIMNPYATFRYEFVFVKNIVKSYLNSFTKIPDGDDSPAVRAPVAEAPTLRQVAAVATKSRARSGPLLEGTSA